MSTPLAALDSRAPVRWLLLTVLALLATALPAGAFPSILNDWQGRYGAISPSGDNASCQLCHANASGGRPWNAYGWDIRNALDDLSCDVDGDGAISNEEAFYCVELMNSDNDGSGYDNVSEIGLGTQPGWTNGPNNTLYDIGTTTPNQDPPTGIGPLDPPGTAPPPPPPPPPPGSGGSVGPLRLIQLVRPGQSLQLAIERAKPHGTIFVLPGVYRELADPTNGLNISKPVHIIGLSTKTRRVVLQNAGNQRNGIVVVPEDRQDCMSCHTSMAPPFPLHSWVPRGMPMNEPMIKDFSISGVTIKDFRNNGLFTENVDGYSIVDVESVGNKNYGIFPTLSRNGTIAYSRATGANDSGIWVETSQNVDVYRNVVEGNTNGFEVSNSDDVHLSWNEVHDNTVGFAILMLPDIFHTRAGAHRIDVTHNHIHDNNKPNTATPGSVLATVPEGTGILHLSVDDSLIAYNQIERNDFAGIGMADYCLANVGSPFACSVDPTVTQAYIDEQKTERNLVEHNVLVGNGTHGTGPFAAIASDIGYLVLGSNGNCFRDNVFSTFFSALGPLPDECP